MERERDLKLTLRHDDSKIFLESHQIWLGPRQPTSAPHTLSRYLPETSRGLHDSGTEVYSVLPGLISL